MRLQKEVNFAITHGFLKMDNRFEIVLIGAGQIGSRHLQGIAKSRLPLHVNVVDPSAKSLTIAKERYEQVLPGGNTEVTFKNNLNDLPENHDLAIIATNSDIRKCVVEELMSCTKVANVILEKVAFQSIKDFKEVISLFKKNNIQSWVNCSRRMYPFYQGLKSELSNVGKIFFSLEGGGWNMASNSVHFLDLFSSLTNDSEITINCSMLDTEIYRSKREKFVEFSGSLHGGNSLGSVLTLKDLHGVTSPSTINISSKKVRYIIFESEGRAMRACNETSWQWEDVNFNVPFQSELTDILIEDILEKKKCNLVTLETSFGIHRPLLNTFINHIKEISGKESLVCPIS